MGDIILEQTNRKNGKTAIRLDKDLLKDLKDLAATTALKKLSLQALVDIAIRKFITALETQNPKEAN